MRSLLCTALSATPCCPVKLKPALWRPQVEAPSVSGRLVTGDYTLSAQGLTATLFEGAGVEQAAGTLLVLPFVRFPAAEFRFKLDWKLPAGRSPDDHQIFPHAPLPEGRQGPVVVSRRGRCCLRGVAPLFEGAGPARLCGPACSLGARSVMGPFSPAH